MQRRGPHCAVREAMGHRSCHAAAIGWIGFGAGTRQRRCATCAPEVSGHDSFTRPIRTTGDIAVTQDWRGPINALLYGLIYAAEITDEVIAGCAEAAVNYTVLGDGPAVYYQAI